MTKVISWEEYLNLRQKKTNEWINFSEQYEVKYRYRKPDGFWTTEKMLFCSCGRDNHNDVKNEFKKRFEDAEVISITYG